MRVLKIIGILVLALGIGDMLLGVLGIGVLMVSSHYDSSQLGGLTRQILLYIAIVIGALAAVENLWKSLRRPR